MLLDLSRLRGGVEKVDRRFEPGALAVNVASDDFRIVAPVSLVGEVHKDGQKVRFVGRLAGTLECNCSRCLDPFDVPVALDLDLLFLSSAANAGGGSTGDEEGGDAIADDDLGVSYYRDDVLDLGEIIREQFYLALPMKPLCREDCRGLCPVCGINRNRETCTCKAEWVDPRLEPLKRLRPGS